MKRIFFGLMAVFLSLVSCPSGVTPDGDHGTLVLVFSATTMKAKTIVPPLDMDIASYTISGSGPHSSTFSLSGVTGASVTQNALLVGAWTIQVDALNANSDLIGSGSISVSITAGETSTATVTVSPLSGTGTLNITLSWASGLIASPLRDRDP